MSERKDRRGAKPGEHRQQPHIRTEEIARQVETMTGLGITQNDMGHILQLSPDTLARHYRDELDRGMSKAKMTLLNRAYQMAMGQAVPEGVSKDAAYRISSDKVDFLLNVHEFDGSAINITISGDDAEL
jgi:hypothetical protein